MMRAKPICVVLLLGCVYALCGCAALGVIDIPVEELKTKYGTPDDRFFAYQGMEVRYRDEGSGPAIILLHGVCSSLETWDAWTQHLKAGYRVIRLDIPGFGITGPAPDKGLYSKESGLALIDGLATRLNIDQFSLAGNSLGGYFAWNYALVHPEKVDKLILIDPAGYSQKMPFVLGFSSHPLIRPFARHMMPRFFFDKAVREVYGDKSKVTPEIRDRYFEFAMREGNKSAYVDIFTVLKRQNQQQGMSAGIVDIKVPTLVMWGTKDEWIPYETIHQWRKDLPSARFISYDGAGHVPMEEIPEATVADAMDFLKMI